MSINNRKEDTEINNEITNTNINTNNVDLNNNSEFEESDVTQKIDNVGNLIENDEPEKTENIELIDEQPSDEDEQIEDSKEELNEQESQEVEEEEEPPPPPPVDAEIVFTYSSDKLSAYIEVLPPENGGEEVSSPMILKAIQESKITTGILKELIFKIPMKKLYNVKKTIAEGTPPTKGIAGSIKPLYDFNKKCAPTVNEDGCVNFKETGLITNVLKDNVICEIIKPIDPVDGVDVFGEPVKGEKAPELKIPKGENTYVSDDGLSLCAKTKGNLRFAHCEYIVDEVYVVDGDVDISTGDIDFVGKVEIRGNILEGYKVKCVGDVVVSGMIEGATIETKGNAEIRGGISGMDSARIKCKGDLKTRFIENATIIVNGNLDTDYILNSNVSCNGELKAMGRKGVIIGGSCTALQLIEAKAIGNDNGAKTNITVGITSEIKEKRNHLICETTACKIEQEKYIKDLQYLNFKKTMGELSDERKKLLRTAKSKIPLLKTKMKMLNAEQEKIQAILEEAAKSKIICHGDVFLGVTISIASESLTITKTIPNPTFMLVDGKVQSL